MAWLAATKEPREMLQALWFTRAISELAESSPLVSLQPIASVVSIAAQRKA